MTATVTSLNIDLHCICSDVSSVSCSASVGATETAKGHNCFQNSHRTGSYRSWFQNTVVQDDRSAVHSRSNKRPWSRRQCTALRGIERATDCATGGLSWLSLCNLSKAKLVCFIWGLSAHRAVNRLNLGYTNIRVKLCRVRVAVFLRALQTT